MTRPVWFALTIVALLLVVAGTALGTQAIGQGRIHGAGYRDGDGKPSAEQLSRLADRLESAGIDTSAEELSDLAETYGVGGAVRIVIWADATGTSVDEVRAMRDAGDGWGQIARTLGVQPGLGWVMGGGHGRNHGMAPGQQKSHDEDRGEDEESEAAEPSESPAS